MRENSTRCPTTLSKPLYLQNERTKVRSNLQVNKYSKDNSQLLRLFLIPCPSKAQQKSTKFFPFILTWMVLSQTYARSTHTAKPPWVSRYYQFLPLRVLTTRRQHIQIVYHFFVSLSKKHRIRAIFFLLPAKFS